MNTIESITFEEGIFNKIYHEIDSVFHNNDLRYCFIYGGSSASKTFSYCQRTIVYMLEGENNNSLVFRKYSTDIDDSIYDTFKGIINDWQLQDYFILQKHFIKCKITGSYTKFKGLDDSEKIKGLSGIKKICLEELNQFDLLDFKQVKKRLRGLEGQQVFGIFNPVSEMSFIKKDIFDNEIFIDQKTTIQQKQINKTGDTVVLRTCYLDNVWIVGPQFYDKHVIADFEKDKLYDINYYNIYALGNWGKLRTGGEFFKNFKTERHVGNYVYQDALPLHIVFDENVLPYLTCNVFQLQNNKLVQIDEIMLSDPLNTLKDTCEEFLKRYKNNKEGLFVYGDATSRKQDTKLQKGQNFYLLVKNYLSIMRPSFRVPQANPSVLMTRGFINDLFLNDKIGIDSKCRNSINDYQYCTEDEDGKVNKKVIRDKITGQSYQEYGHCFVAYTLIETVKGAVRIDKIKVGDLVLTRNGYKKVNKVFNNGLKEVRKYNIGGNILECTPNHKIYFNGKFTEAQQIVSGIFCIFDKNKKICKKKLINVKTHLPLINTPLKKLVYDIEVEDEHEYFANGILVHNCSDALRYINFAMFQKEYKNFILGK